MKFKKSILGIVLSVLLALSAPAMACDNYTNVAGNFDIDVSAYQTVYDYDALYIPGGGASGGGNSYADTDASAQGAFSSFRIWGHRIALGSVEGKVSVTSGALMESDSRFYAPEIEGCGYGIGVESRTEAIGITAGHLDLSVLGFAAAYGDLSGYAGEYTGDGSYMSNRNGLTSGYSTQEASGSFDGGAVVAGIGSADIDVNIKLSGVSVSQSYKTTTFGENSITKTLGTNSAINTVVETSGSAEDYLIGIACLNGGWNASGNIGSMTTQMTRGGNTMATMQAGYCANGSLNTNFNGTATGYTATSITKINGLKGSINSSYAGATVTANMSNLD